MAGTLDGSDIPLTKTEVVAQFMAQKACVEEYLRLGGKLLPGSPRKEADKWG